MSRLRICCRGCGGSREKFMTRSLLRPVFLLALLCLALPLQAATQDWLLAQRQADGRIATAQDSVGEELASTEAWRALAEAGVAPVELAATAAYAAGLAEPSAELAARRLLAQRAANANGGTDAGRLLMHVQPYAGFGYLPGYEADVASTAWALQALAGRDDIDAQVLGYAVGWLQQNQRADGGWALGANNDSNVYLTAAALRALWHYRARYNVTTSLSQASAFLLAARNPQGLWADDVDSASALLALLPLQNPPDAQQASVDALDARQDAAGSLGGDVFASALWLRLRRLADETHSNPDLGSIALRVLEAESSSVMGGVAVSLTGPLNRSGVTDVAGRYQALDLPPGRYAVRITRAGYRDLTLHATLQPGQALDLGDQALIADEVVATTGKVRGQIVDESGQPLAGARVFVDAREMLSNANGEFEFLDVPVGRVDLRVELAGYYIAFGYGDVPAGCTMLFNATLWALPSGGTDLSSAVEGRVTDLTTGAPLADAVVTLSGATTASVVTDADGRYRIHPIQPGPTTFTVTHDGHQPATVSAEVEQTQLVQFSPALAAFLTPEPSVTGTRLRGRIVDAVTQRPVIGARVRVDDGDSVQEATSNADGDFSVANVGRGYATINVQRHEYVEVGFGLAVPPVESIDAGQLRLRPVNAPQIRPDLRLQEVSASAVSSDPEELIASGSLQLRVDNRYGAALDRDVEIIAFVDVDADRAYVAGVDTLLGSVRQRLTLNADSPAQDISIPVAGHLPFRDAPIAALLDPADEVAELREDNNFGVSAGRCRAVPPVMDEGRIVEAMRWSGDPSLPPDVRLSAATAAVAQLSDDNGDGRIDLNDTPDLVVPVGSGGERGSWGVVALSGDDLHLLWKFNQFKISQYASPAVGDIDGDDKVEIALVDARRNAIVVLENDGTLKWTAPTGESLPCGLLYCPPDAGDALLMANLVADERPEIIINKRVYDAQGELLWTGEFSGAEYGVLGAHPIAADLDMDGHNELLGGRTAYRGDGSVYWHRDDLPADSHAAVGNFDNDPQPEVVLVTPGRVHLLQHDGTTIWGPVLLPGGYGGGPPTIADYDGDGAAEIGVVSATAFSVIDGDGTVLWSAALDDPLGTHSAAVFDFEGDGRLEVVYHDHNDLHIVDAVTGVERVRVHNTHLTAFENPVIADLDHDGEAEIILSSTNDWQAQTTGLRVFKSDNGPWAGAGDTWNQHDFHIDNIDRNGIVPAVEPPYWLGHNSNRKNTLNDRDPVGRADFSIGAPQLIDRGAGQNPLVRVRVGNAGQPTNAEQVKVALYLGDPAAGGSLLATSAPATVLPGRWRSFDLELSSAPASGELYVVVDPDQRFAECDEGNNVAHGPYQAVQPRLSLSLDAPAAADPGATVTLQAQVHNDGAAPAQLRVQLWVETLHGEGVATLDTSAATTLAPQQSLQHAAAWSSGGVQAGRYLLRARAVPTGGLPAAETSREIQIRAVPGGNPAVSLRAATARSQYADTAEVRMEAVVVNRSGNQALDALALQLEIVAPGGGVVFSEQQYLAQLAPGMADTRRTHTGFVDAPAGAYQLRASLRRLDNGEVLASDTHDFSVVDTPLAALSGRVEHTADEIAPGDVQECRLHFDNSGAAPLNALPVRLALLRLADPPGLVASVERSIDVPANGSRMETYTPATTGLAGGEYACAAQIQRDGEWTSLAFSAFVVQARVDLAPVVAALPADVALGARFEAGFDVSNSGPSPAAGVALDLVLPPRLAFIEAVQPAGVACTTVPTGVRCALGELAVGETRRLVLALRGLSSGPAALSASTSATQTDGNSGNDTVSASVTVRGQVNLAAVGLSCPRPLLSGGVGRISVNASNAGPDAASAVNLQVGAPPGVRLLDYRSDHGSCSIDATGLHCGLGNLAVGEAARLHFVFSSTSQVVGPTAWPVSVSASQDEGSPADNSLILWRSFVHDLLFYDGFDSGDTCTPYDDVIWVNGFE